MSPELETLDQLLGGDTLLSVIRMDYPDRPRFLRGMMGLLNSGDIRLVGDGLEIPKWRWQAVLEGEGDRILVSLTKAGAARIA